MCMVKIKSRCLKCEREFETTYRKERKNPPSFCSIECRGGKKDGKTSWLDCETCGKEFFAYRGKNSPLPRVCSHKCRSGIVNKWTSPDEFSWKNSSQEVIKTQLMISFDKRTEKSSGCWKWKGSKNKGGYGSFHSDGNGKRIAAHRLSWKLFRGEIPDNLCVRHKCNNPECVNPDHLLLGTLKENSQDRIDAGNSCKGSKNKKSKIDEKLVKEIKESIRLGIRGLAKKYGISRSVICSIKHERTWKHVE